MPPVKPMLAKLVPEIPPGALYEPKFDGFRAVIFRDGDEVELGSRNERPLTRYFPDIVEAARRELPERCVVDGEIILVLDGRLEFDALQQRIHPAASRINLLARETPASFVAFDLLALGDRSYVDEPFAERRAALEAALAGASVRVHLAPITSSVETARRWFDLFEGAGLDGVVAKPPSIPYVPDRRVMFKIKHERTADCVVAGFRWHKKGERTMIGSLLLGLYDADGALHHVGVTAAFTNTARKELVTELAPLREHALEDHPWRDWAEVQEDASATGQRMPGATSRWNRGKDLSWVPLRPERVCEVAYDHMQGTRFRHAAKFLCWRPDKRPRDCRYDQLEVTPAFELERVFGARSRS